MRRFYIQSDRFSLLRRALLDLCAPIYEQIVCLPKNIGMTAFLASLAASASASARGRGTTRTMLDFGCGPGLASLACARAMARRGWHLRGFDSSPRMRVLAEGNGLPQTESVATSTYDAVLACYVLDASFDVDESATLLGALKPGGALAANLHDMSEADGTRLCAQLESIRTGKLVRGTARLSGDPEAYLVFRVSNA
ncbi:MAG: class I SAM-dependent methyltransferase [Planctomycetota bacterium]